LPDPVKIYLPEKPKKFKPENAKSLRKAGFLRQEILSDGNQA
jgi:hypothetical protein